MAGTILKIKEMYRSFNSTKKKIADYILENSEDILHITIKDLAENCGVSQAAVVRFCKQLQFNGFKDFKIDIASDVLNSNRDNEEEGKYTDIKPGDDLKSIIENVCINNKKSIDDTLSVLDYNEVKRAVDAVHKAKRIDFYGVGASWIVALDGMQKFMRIGKYSCAYSDAHLQVTAASTLQKGDVVFALSYSGETKDIIDAVKVAKESGALIVAVTKYGINMLSEISDINLFLSSPEVTMRSGAMASRIAQLNVIDIIFSGVASIEYKDIKKYLDRSRKATKLKKYK